MTGTKHGEAHHNCRYPDEDVELIRQLYEAGLELSERERRRCQLGYKGIAARFECPCGCGRNISVRTVRDIVHYRCRL